MKRKTKRTQNRWLDRPQSREVVSPYADTPQPTREPGYPRTTQTGLGPYEASYDVSNGYGHDRSIILP